MNLGHILPIGLVHPLGNPFPASWLRRIMQGNTYLNYIPACTKQILVA